MAHKGCFGYKEFQIPDMLVEMLKRQLLSLELRRDWGQEHRFAKL